MRAAEVIGQLARERRVEILIERMARHSLTADLRDLSQMVYTILLQYDSEKILDLWSKNEINYFIAAIIRNQLFSDNSPYYKTIKKFGALSDNLEHLARRSDDED